MTAEEEKQAPEVPKVRKAECAVCGGVRNCDIRGGYLVSKDYDQVQHWRTWYLLECRGCEYMFVQTVDEFSEDFDHDEHGNIEYNKTIRYWPALSKREMPKWMDFSLHSMNVVMGLNAKEANALSDAMVELYGALNNDLHMLAGIGIRTVFDIASQSLGICSNSTFTRKLELLVDKRVVSKDRLETLVEVGNATAHRGWRPTPSELSTMMDVLAFY